MRKDLTILGIVLWLVLGTVFTIIGLNLMIIELAIMGFILGFAGFIIFIAGLIMGEKNIAPPPPAFNSSPGFNNPINPGSMPPPSTAPRGYQTPMNQGNPGFQTNQNQTTMNPFNNKEEDAIAQIERWGQLKEKGLITEEEFQRKKNELL